MTARAPVYIDSGKLHVFEDGDTLPPWLSPSSMAWENLTGVPAGITQLADLTGPGYAKVDAAGAWSVQAAIPQADVSGLATALAGLQPISARLTAIAGLTDAAGWLHDDGSGNWALTTPTKSDVGLGSVENTALSTWAGSTSLTTLGTVASGTWHGTAIADAYISSAAAWNAKEGGLGNPSTSGYLLSSTSAGVRSWVAPYSLPTATASVLGGVKVGTGLAISSGVLSVSYGTAAGTACVGNDSRLSDSRAPTAHALDGALHTISGKTAGQVLMATGATTFGFATISGDATLSGAGALTLATLLTTGSAGSAASVPTLTWDAKGRLTAAGSAAISIPHTQISDWAGATQFLPLAGGIMTANINFANVATGFGPGLVGTIADNDAWRITGYSSAADGGSLEIATADGGNEPIYVRQYQYNSSSPFGTLVRSASLLNESGNTSFPGTVTGSAIIRAGGTASQFLKADGSVDGNSYLTANQPISLTGAVTGSGTTPIATSFANTHLAGINQDLTTTSSPTFGMASLGTWAGGPAFAWFGAAGQNNTTNGNSGFLQLNSGDVFMCAPSGHMVDIYYNKTEYLRADSSGVSILSGAPLLAVTPPSTFTGLITANGGISGNLTGHASLDIPLTGSVAVTGSIQTTQGLYAASGMVGMYSMYDNIFTIGNNAHNIQVNNTTGETNFIGLTSVGMQGSLTVSGTFTPAVNLRSSNYTITLADQGKMIVSIYALSLPSFSAGTNVGFWCLVNWHVGGSGSVFGPTTSGTAWNLRGQVITVRTSMPFTGVVSWDGYTWYAG